jgi:hypothetical protein
LNHLVFLWRRKITPVAASIKLTKFHFDQIEPDHYGIVGQFLRLLCPFVAKLPELLSQVARIKTDGLRKDPRSKLRGI